MNIPMLEVLQSEITRWLLDYYLLATVLLGVVLLVTKLLAQPARRMAIHWSTAGGLLLLAALCAIPGWSLIHMLSAPATLPMEPPIPQFDPGKQSLMLPSEPPLVLQQAPIEDPLIQIPSQPAPEPMVSWNLDFQVLSCLALAAGSTLVLVWLSIGHLLMRRLRSRANDAPTEVLALFESLSNRSNERSPTLGVVAKLPVAAALGLMRPMVLLPESYLEDSCPEKLRTVLSHELAHIRHRDLWLLALMRGLLLLMWPHPLYWLWRRNVRLDQETLADAAAADVTDRTDYAEQLIAWARVAAEVRTPHLASSVGLWESPSQLKRRIAILLDEKLTVLRECSVFWKISSALSLMIVVGCLSLVTLQPASTIAAKPAEERKTDAASNSRWTKQLNNGAKVELLAIGTNAPDEQVKWWDAEGVPLDNLPFEVIASTNIDPLPNRQLAFRVHDLPPDASVRWKTQPASNASSGTIVIDGIKKPHGYYSHEFERPRAGGTFSLRVGVAAGDWITMAKGVSAAHSSLLQSTVFSAALADKNGNAVVVISHSLTDVDTRAVAFDKKGNEWVSTSRQGTSAGKQNQSQWTFVGLEADQVKEFGLQIRQYEWVEYGKLPSQPKGETPATENKSAAAPSPQPNGGSTLGLQYDPAKESGLGGGLTELNSDDRFQLVPTEQPVHVDFNAASSLVAVTSPSDEDETGEPKAEFQVQVASPPGEFENGEINSIDLRLGPTVPSDVDERRPPAYDDELSAYADEITVNERPNFNKLLYPLHKQLEPRRKPNTIVGICIDKVGQPVADVDVRLYSQPVGGFLRGTPTEVARTKSNARGEFTLTNAVDIKKLFPKGLPSSISAPRDQHIYTLIGRKQGRVPGRHSELAASIAKSGNTTVWVMQQAQTLIGRITDTEGNPVEGAKVSVGHVAMFNGLNDLMLGAAVTNADGNYAISDLPAHDVAAEQRQLDAMLKKNPALAQTMAIGAPLQQLLVTHPKFAAKRVSVRRIPGKANAQLRPGSTIEGKLSFPAGEGPDSVSKGVLYLQRDMTEPKPGNPPAPYSYQIQSTKIDQQGRYRFDSLPAGTYHLSANVPSWVTTGIEDVVTIAGKRTTAPDIRMTSGGRVRIQLLEEKSGQPLQFAEPKTGWVHRVRNPPIKADYHGPDLAKFSKTGMAVIQVAPGRYEFPMSFPSEDGRSYLTFKSYHDPISGEKLDTLHRFEVEEGKTLDVAMKLTRQTMQQNAVLSSMRATTKEGNTIEINEFEGEDAPVVFMPVEQTVPSDVEPTPRN